LLDLMSCSGQPMNSLSLSLPQSIYHFVNAWLLARKAKMTCNMISCKVL
jgi:hypothetical protein